MEKMNLEQLIDRVVKLENNIKALEKRTKEYLDKFQKVQEKVIGNGKTCSCK